MTGWNGTSTGVLDTGVPDLEGATAEMRSLDALLDAALADSFPASDPPALCSPRPPIKGWSESAAAKHNGLGRSSEWTKSGRRR
jgi:hypothetical protein